MEFNMKSINLKLIALAITPFGLAFSPLQGMKKRTFEEMNQRDAAVQDLDSLIDAVKGNNLEVVRSLIRKGIDLSQAREQVTEKTPLTLAAERNNTEMIRLLLNAGAPINATDKFGLTALHYAVSQNYLEATKLLVIHGADIDTKESTPHIIRIGALNANHINALVSRRTPLEIARHNRNRNIICYLCFCNSFLQSQKIPNSSATAELITHNVPLSVLPDYFALAIRAGFAPVRGLYAYLIKNNMIEHPTSAYLPYYIKLAHRFNNKKALASLINAKYRQCDNALEIMDARRKNNNQIIAYKAPTTFEQTLLLQRIISQHALQHAIQRNTNYTDVLFI